MASKPKVVTDSQAAKDRVTFSDLVKATPEKPMADKGSSDLFSELSKLKEYALKDEYAKKPNWNNLVNVVLTNTGKRETGHVNEIFVEAKNKQRQEIQMKAIQNKIATMFKKTQVELYGKPKESLSEQIQGISNPALKVKYQSLENRYKEIKE